MVQKLELASWYTSVDEGWQDLAQHAFHDAVHAFSSELSKDPKKTKLLQDLRINNVEAVLEAVLQAQKHYQERRGDSKLRHALDGLAERIGHYGAILDVFVSHHPEYVALVWGAMKVLFVGVTNHQKLLSRLSQGLTEIANILPRAQLLIQLYPTQHIYQVIVSLYSYILRFLIRGLGWYQENKLQHALHSITRPSELRYDDILTRMAGLSRNLDEAASAGSHAEQRDMHNSIRRQLQQQEVLQQSIESLTGQVAQLQLSLAADRALNDCARVEFRQELSNIQLAQFLHAIRVHQLPEPADSLQASIFLATRRSTKLVPKGPPFWLQDEVQQWNRSQASSLLVINGTWKVRSHLQAFCVSSIMALQEDKVPVLWALRSTPLDESRHQETTPIDLLKYLIVQAIKLNKNLHMDASLAPYLQSYLRARTQDDWINILASVLAGIPLLYIMVDLQALSASSEEGFTIDYWLATYRRIFAVLKERNPQTVVRVVLTRYSSLVPGGPLTKDDQSYMITVGKPSKERQLRGQVKRNSSKASSTVANASLNLSRLPYTAKKKSKTKRLVH